MRFELHAGDATLVGEELGSGPALVLLHAGAERRTVWDPIVEVLVAAGYSCATLDQRGHGESTGSRDASFELFARDVELLRRHVGRPAVYVGSSLGGLSALAMVARAGTENGAPIAGLVLVDVVPELDRERVRAGLTATLGARAAASPLVLDILDRTEELTNAARALVVPTLLVRADRSFGLTAEAGARFRALVPSAEEVVVTNSGHLIARDQPLALAEALLAFAARPDVSRGLGAPARHDAIGCAERWLELRDARSVAHLNGTLLEHLRRTALWLERWDAPERVRIAGLCHAAYGTEGFDLALTRDRAELADAIGEPAEHIVYDYCACERDFFYGELGANAGAYRDRKTGVVRSLEPEALRDQLLLTLANELDVALGAPAGSALERAIVDLLRQIEPHCPGQAASALRTLAQRKG